MICQSVIALVRLEEALVAYAWIPLRLRVRVLKEDYYDTLVFWGGGFVLLAVLFGTMAILCLASFFNGELPRTAWYRSMAYALSAFVVLFLFRRTITRIPR